MMLTRDQAYGISAHKNVQAIKENKAARKYGVMCHKLPILIHTAGLAQALAFVESRKGDIYKVFLNDLGKTVEETEVIITTKAREADLKDYMRLTAQVMEALVWYKRFAQSILGVDVSDSDDEEVVE